MREKTVKKCRAAYVMIREGSTLEAALKKNSLGSSTYYKWRELSEATEPVSVFKQPTATTDEFDLSIILLKDILNSNLSISSKKSLIQTLV